MLMDVGPQQKMKKVLISDKTLLSLTRGKGVKLFEKYLKIIPSCKIVEGGSVRNLREGLEDDTTEEEVKGANDSAAEDKQSEFGNVNNDSSFYRGTSQNSNAKFFCVYILLRINKVSTKEKTPTHSSFEDVN